MERGFKIKTHPNNVLSVSFEIGKQDKEALLADFSKLFSDTRKMIDWFDDTAEDITKDITKTEQKLEYFPQLYWGLKGLVQILDIMMSAGIREQEIVEALDLPF